MRHRQQRNEQLLKEKDFQQQVIQVARLTGWLVFHDYDSRRNARGLPDTILTRPGREGSPGRLLFCELKSQRGKLRPEQEEWLATLATVLGVEVYVWRPSNFDTIVDILQSSEPRHPAFPSQE